MKISDKYKPYNYSKAKCFVVTLNITADGNYKVESKLPKQMKVIKGLYVTSSADAGQEKIVGLLNLMFNEGILKNFQLPVTNTKLVRHHSHPIPLNEEVKPNSTLMGVYYHRPVISSYPFTIKIYLHYEEQL
jgi:hypothetical protein